MYFIEGWWQEGKWIDGAESEPQNLPLFISLIEIHWSDSFDIFFCLLGDSNDDDVKLMITKKRKRGGLFPNVSVDRMMSPCRGLCEWVVVVEIHHEEAREMFMKKYSSSASSSSSIRMSLSGMNGTNIKSQNEQRRKTC